MPSKIEKIENEAFKLPRKDRADLASRLLSSLEEGSKKEIEMAWMEEAERRLHLYKAGKMKAIPAEKVFKEIRSKLKKKFGSK
ncbi:MAG: addiction module protein [Deltaproteobacteria bacterium]|nr:addiction module protein [Deltaproteobacteria bacterium]